MTLDGILHDSDAYHNPNAFIPERFMEVEFGTKPGVNLDGRRNDHHFGGGRVRFRDYLRYGCPEASLKRICIGMNLANNSMVSHNTAHHSDVTLQAMRCR